MRTSIVLESKKEQSLFKQPNYFILLWTLPKTIPYALSQKMKNTTARATSTTLRILVGTGYFVVIAHLLLTYYQSKRLINTKDVFIF